MPRLEIEHMFVSMTKQELEYLRRSIAMLPPQSIGLNREDAMRLLAELEDRDRRLDQVRDGLATLVALASGETAP